MGDINILIGIKNHTIPKVDMNTLEKIFQSDFKPFIDLYMKTFEYTKDINSDSYSYEHNS